MLLGKGLLYQTAASAPPPGAWDLDNATTTGKKSFATGISSLYAFTIGDSESKLYAVGWSGKIRQHTITAGDISTASYDGTGEDFDATGKESQASSLRFNTDGTKMFITGFASNNIHEYALSTAWRPKTATFTSSFSLSSQVTTATGAGLSSDGTILRVIDWSNNNIEQYSMTAFNVSSLAHAPTKSTGDISGETTQGHGLFVHPLDDTRFWVTDVASKTYQYDMTAGDVSSASYNSISFTDLSNVSDVHWSPLGDWVYICNTGGSLVQYPVSL